MLHCEQRTRDHAQPRTRFMWVILRGPPSRTHLGLGLVVGKKVAAYASLPARRFSDPPVFGYLSGRPSSAESAVFVRCSSCSKNISHRAPTCPFCGAANEQAADEIPAEEPAASKPGSPGQTVTQFCDHGAVAEEAVREFQSSGFSLDYTVASAATLDLLISDRYGSDGLGGGEESWRPSEEHRKVIAMVGSYVGEVIRAKYSGDWADDPDHPGKPLFVQLDLGVSGMVWPLERAYRRLKNGEADSLLNYMELVQNEVTGGSDLGAAMDWASQASDFIKKDRLDVAKTFIERALAIDPEHAEAWFCRGLVNERLGKKVDATFGYEQALRFGEHRDRGFRAHLRDKIEVLRKTSVSALAAQAAEQPWPTGDYPSPDDPDAAEADGTESEAPAQLSTDLEMRLTDSEPSVGEGATAQAEPAASARRATSGSLAVERSEQSGLEKVFGAEAFAGSEPDEPEEPEAAPERAEPAANASKFSTDTISPISVRPSGPLPVNELRSSGVQTALTLPDRSGELPKVDPESWLGDEDQEGSETPAKAPPVSPEPTVEPPPRLAKTVNSADAKELNPEAVALAHDAASLVSRGRFEEASVCYREALGLSPMLHSARLGAAVAFLALAKPAEAMSVLEPLVKARDPAAVITAGRVLATDDRFEDAVALIDAAIETHPDSSALRRARGQHLFSLGRWVDAAATFEKALQRDPADAATWFGFANSVLKLSDDKRSRLALAGYLGVAHPADVAGVRFAQRELTRLAVK